MQENWLTLRCFIKLASYKGTKSTGNVITSIGLDIDLHNRHVILLEDIIDSSDSDVCESGSEDDSEEEIENNKESF
jgi:hypothetical protein